MRGLPLLIIIVLLVIAGAWFLSTRAKEQPTHMIEANVTANAATR